MNDVVIYTRANCPYCRNAKLLLESRGIDYREIDTTGDGELTAEMIARSGRRTVPQIFIAGEPIGGFTDLTVLAREGRLEAPLRSGVVE